MVTDGGSENVLFRPDYTAPSWSSYWNYGLSRFLRLSCDARFGIKSDPCLTSSPQTYTCTLRLRRLAGRSSTWMSLSCHIECTAASYHSPRPSFATTAFGYGNFSSSTLRRP